MREGEGVIERYRKCTRDTCILKRGEWKGERERGRDREKGGRERKRVRERGKGRPSVTGIDMG